MGSRKRKFWDEDFDDMKGCFNNDHSHHNEVNSLVGLIFGIVSFSIKLAFKIVEIVFQVLFGLLSGIGSGSRNAHNVTNAQDKTDFEKQNIRYTVNDIKQEAASSRESGDGKSNAGDNVREFRKTDSGKKQDTVKAEENKGNTEKVHNKDFFIFLFILTVIPAIVALAMGKLLYAGAIGAVGFGLMLLVGVIAGIAGRIKKKPAKQKAEEEKEEANDDDLVEKLIKDSFEKLFVIRKDIDKISDAGIRAKLEAICCTGEKIIGEVRTNPEGLTHVRKFFYYYLDAFGEIVKKYLRLSSFEESSKEVGELMDETEKSFTDIDGIFKELCEKLLEKDMMNLKAEINVIKNSN